VELSSELFPPSFDTMNRSKTYRTNHLDTRQAPNSSTGVIRSWRTPTTRRAVERCASVGIPNVCDECQQRGEDKSSMTHIGADKTIIPAEHDHHQRTLPRQLRLKHVLASQFGCMDVMREYLERPCQRVRCTGKHLRIRGRWAET
jgi:hypothetical protein